MKPEIKFENGILTINVQGLAVDGDKDGKASASAKIELVVDAAEVISEVAKKDLPWLQLLLAQIKI